MASPKLISIDPTGNLLIISENPTRLVPFHFRVSSKVLSLSSPIFASLFPDPAAHTNKYQIVLRGDAPEPLGTLLELCHFKRTLPLPHAQLQGFYSLAIVSQKYQILTPLIPWITLWAGPLHAADKLDLSNVDDLEKWLIVACVYNQGPLFRKITKQAVLTGNTKSLGVSGRWNPPYNDIIEKIDSERINALSKLTAVALTLLSRYQTKEPICKHPTNSKECDAMLLGSVLKNLMDIGVYQPIPDAPYSGMTVMGLKSKIQELQFMWYPTHDACGAGVKDESKSITKSVHEILDEVKGLDLGNFKTINGAGRAENLVLTAVGDLKDEAQQQQQQEEEQEEEERRESRDKDEAEVQAQGTSESLANTVVVDTELSQESGTFVMAEAPAGVIGGFLETSGTLEDFRSQRSFGAGELSQTTTINLGDGEEEKKYASGNPSIDEKPKENEIEEICVANLPLTEEEQKERNGQALTFTKSLIWGKDMEAAENETLFVEEQTNNEGILGKQNEQLRPMAKKFVPSLPLGSSTLKQNSHYTLRSRKELTMELKPAPIQHSLAKANAEAKGQSWETPGPELVQKYQRGPRHPFHPAVTVRDVSDHHTEIKSMIEIFPQLDIKVIVEFLRQNKWDCQAATLMLRSGGVVMNSVGEESGTSIAVSSPVLEPIVPVTPKLAINPPQERSEETAIITRKSSGGNSAANTVICQETSNVPSEPSKSLSTVSVSPLITGASSSVAGDLHPRFWPEADNAVVMRALGLPENKRGIKKLLTIFPLVTADRGLIDVLYRAGWDTEKAARTLEEWGFKRVERGGSGGDGGGKLKPKSKEKGRAGPMAKEEGESK